MAGTVNALSERQLRLRERSAQFAAKARTYARSSHQQRRQSPGRAKAWARKGLQARHLEASHPRREIADEVAGKGLRQREQPERKAGISRFGQSPRRF